MTAAIALRHAVLPEQQSSPDAAGLEPLLVDLAGAAKLLSISKRHVEDLAREGVLPKPIHLGRSLRFEVAALRRFVEQEASKAADTNGEGGDQRQRARQRDRDTE